MRVKLLLAVAVLHFFVDGSVALAGESPPGCQASISGDVIGCGGEINVSVPGKGGGPGGQQPGARPENNRQDRSDTKTVMVERMVTRPDGTECVINVGRQVPRDGPDSLPREGTDRAGPYPACPPGSGSEAAPETPAQIAARHWQDVPLPRPEPHIAPGRAITGKLAYLETRGHLQHTYTQDTPLGLLEINARGTYTVDWGDGETSGPFDFEGMPWPDGRITHDYLNVGTYDIVVTERWSATWRMGGESGSLQELRTVGRIEDFPVEQVQAVRER